MFYLKHTTIYLIQPKINEHISIIAGTMLLFKITHWWDLHCHTKGLASLPTRAANLLYEPSARAIFWTRALLHRAQYGRGWPAWACGAACNLAREFTGPREIQCKAPIVHHGTITSFTKSYVAFSELSTSRNIWDATVALWPSSHSWLWQPDQHLLRLPEAHPILGRNQDYLWCLCIWGQARSLDLYTYD